MLEKIRRCLCLLLLLWVAACGPQPRIWVEELPQYDAIFSRQKGWTGADGAYSVALADNQILWLFGDTWYGEVRQGRHVDAVIINNSIAIQRGLRPPDASVAFYSGSTPAGRPLAFIRPANGRGWFWLYDGIQNAKGLYLFLVHLERTTDPQSFGFKLIGSQLGHVSNPAESPNQWLVTRYRIPWARFTASGDTIFGSALLKENKNIYIYGTTEEVTGEIRHKSMILARVPETQLEQFDQWRFYSGGQWTADFNQSTRLCGDMANEFSVSYLAALQQYILVYTEKGFSKHIVIRFAPHPWGPWSEPKRIYECPEAEWHAGIFCYAAKGHPDLSFARDELILTYVANASDFEKMAADARLYRPRFLRLKFKSR